MRTTWCYRGFVLDLREPFTPDEEKIMREYLDYIRESGETLNMKIEEQKPFKVTKVTQ